MAVVSIVAYHADPDWFPLAPVSLDAFFVLSTFLVTTLLLDALDRHGSVQPRRFFTRRVRRLAAGLAAVLATVLGLAALGAYPNPDLGRTAVGAALLHANVAQFSGDYFSAFAQRNPLEHTWSLSVEEHFYLVVAAVVALAWLLGRRSMTRARVLLGLAALATAVASVAVSRHLLAAGATPNRIYMGTDTRAVAAAAGVGLGALTPRSLGPATAHRAGRGCRVVGPGRGGGGRDPRRLASHARVVRPRWMGADRGGRRGGRRRRGAPHGTRPHLRQPRAALGRPAQLRHLPVAPPAAGAHRGDGRRSPVRGPGRDRGRGGAVAPPRRAAVPHRRRARPGRRARGRRHVRRGRRAGGGPAPAGGPVVGGPADRRHRRRAPGRADPAARVGGRHRSTPGRAAVGGPPVHGHVPGGPRVLRRRVLHRGGARGPGRGARRRGGGHRRPGAVPHPLDQRPRPPRARAGGRRALGPAVPRRRGRPVVLAMSPGARRELGVGLHLRRMVGDDAANLVLDAEAARWPDAIADRFAGDPEGPRRIMVVGDSVAYSLATDFRPEGTVVWDQSRHGCDPSPGDRVTVRNGRDRSAPACDWRADWARAVDAWDPEVVVWHTGTWSTYDRVVDGEQLEVGDAAWRAAVAGAHAEALDILGARGARVVVAVVAPAWETAPGKPVETRPEESARRMPELLAAVRSAAAGRDRVTVLDTSEVVCEPTCDRADLRDDGVHYTPEGARVVGEWLSARLPGAP